MRTITTAFALLALAALASAARRSAVKRAYYQHPLYESHYLTDDHADRHALIPTYLRTKQQQQQQGPHHQHYLHHANVAPVYYSTNLRHPPSSSFDFGSFLPSYEDSSYQYHAPSYGHDDAAAGYDYPAPQGPKFDETPSFLFDDSRFAFPSPSPPSSAFGGFGGLGSLGSLGFDDVGVPDSFEILIESALRRPQIPDPKRPDGVAAPPRRILTNSNQHLFYRYPGHVPDAGLRVRVPLNQARPSRIVVPQHGAVAFGSGGLGYSTLPGGRLAIGSGSVGLVNVAVVRSNLLPPNPQATARPPTRGFRVPSVTYPQQQQQASSRSFEVTSGEVEEERLVNTEDPPLNDDKSVSANSYTVFAQPADDQQQQLEQQLQQQQQQQLLQRKNATVLHLVPIR